jgi:hypothetical protein
MAREAEATQVAWFGEDQELKNKMKTEFNPSNMRRSHLLAPGDIQLNLTAMPDRRYIRARFHHRFMIVSDWIQLHVVDRFQVI